MRKKVLLVFSPCGLNKRAETLPCELYLRCAQNTSTEEKTGGFSKSVRKKYFRFHLLFEEACSEHLSLLLSF